MSKGDSPIAMPWRAAVNPQAQQIAAPIPQAMPMMTPCAPGVGRGSILGAHLIGASLSRNSAANSSPPPTEVGCCRLRSYGDKPAQYRLVISFGSQCAEKFVILRSGGGARMRKIWTVVIAISLGLAVGACSKCEIPDLLPKMCKTGTGTNGM